LSEIKWVAGVWALCYALDIQKHENFNPYCLLGEVENLYGPNKLNGVNGVLLGEGAYALQLDGCDTTEDMPLQTMADIDSLAPPTAAQLINAENYSIKGFSFLTKNISTDTFRQALNNGQPIVAGINVLSSSTGVTTPGWLTANLSAKNDYSQDPDFSTPVFHAFCVVGYDDSHPTPDGPGAFKVINSWGTGWGDNGYGWISYSCIKEVYSAVVLDTAGLSSGDGATGVLPAGGTTTAILRVGDSNYTVNGVVYNTDMAPYIEDGRTFLPLRCITDAAGIPDSDISWDPITQEVTVSTGDGEVQFTIGSMIMFIDGAATTMDTVPVITNGRTCLPVAWVAQMLGASIAWDGTTHTVIFTF
jgi:hypothetical protein